MKHLFVALSILIFTGVQFQVQGPKFKTVKLELSVEDTQLIIDALQERPYAKVAGLIQNIVRQAEASLKDTIAKKK